MGKTSFWRFGGTPVPATEVAGIARRFEAQGWDGLVVGQDIGILPDSYLFLAAYQMAPLPVRLAPPRPPPGWILAVYGPGRPPGARVLVEWSEGALLEPAP